MDSRTNWLGWLVPATVFSGAYIHMVILCWSHPFFNFVLDYYNLICLVPVNGNAFGFVGLSC